MQPSSRKAFTMIELVFVIVIIGILSAIAIPKLTATRDDALITKGLSILASVRSALSTEKQKLILQGEFGNIISLRGTGTGIFTTMVYKDSANNDVNGSRVLEYDISACTGVGCWSTSDGVTYTFKSTQGDCTYKLQSNRFDDITTGGCTDLK